MTNKGENDKVGRILSVAVMSVELVRGIKHNVPLPKRFIFSINITQKLSRIHIVELPKIMGFAVKTEVSVYLKKIQGDNLLDGYLFPQSGDDVFQYLRPFPALCCAAQPASYANLIRRRNRKCLSAFSLRCYYTVAPPSRLLMRTLSGGGSSRKKAGREECEKCCCASPECIIS